MTIILSNLNLLKKFFTGRFLGKFAVKRILKIPPHLVYVATLPCETLMSAKPANNDKLQGNCSFFKFVVELLMTKWRKVYCWVCEWKKIKIGKYLAKFKQERDCLMHFLRLLAVCWPGAQSTLYITNQRWSALNFLHWPTASKHGCLGRGVYAREDEWLVGAEEVVVELSNGMPNWTTSRKYVTNRPRT